MPSQVETSLLCLSLLSLVSLRFRSPTFFFSPEWEDVAYLKPVLNLFGTDFFIVRNTEKLRVSSAQITRWNNLNNMSIRDHILVKQGKVKVKIFPTFSLLNCVVIEWKRRIQDIIIFLCHIQKSFPFRCFPFCFSNWKFESGTGVKSKVPLQLQYST